MKVLCQVNGRYTCQLETMSDVSFADSAQPIARSWRIGEIIEVALQTAMTARFVDTVNALNAPKVTRPVEAGIATDWERDDALAERGTI